MILMHTDSPVCRSRHCTAFENAAEPKYSRTWYRAAMSELMRIGKSFCSSKPVRPRSCTTFSPQ